MQCRYFFVPPSVEGSRGLLSVWSLMSWKIHLRAPRCRLSHKQRCQRGPRSSCETLTSVLPHVQPRPCCLRQTVSQAPYVICCRWSEISSAFCSRRTRKKFVGPSSRRLEQEINTRALVSARQDEKPCPTRGNESCDSGRRPKQNEGQSHTVCAVCL